MGFQENFREIQIRSGLSVVEIAKKTGIARPTVSSWINDPKRTPSPDNIIKLAEVLNATEQELINPNRLLDVNSGIVSIDKIDHLAGAGGYIDIPIENKKIAFDKKLFANGLNPKYLKIIEVIGDSMQPDFDEGDYAFVDMRMGRDNFVKIAGTYIVRVDDLIYIKDVEFLPHNEIKLISTNKKYGDIYPHREGYDYEILGKVCGKIKFEKGLIFD
ncbi:MAG: LexA family transcriptional regulator [Campylobacteraceae bacterium]|jgi:phage repressor protein C with HTH and peptisase S24 domain|nr:LexA family transcriptional regulator [Campylobacteraceae bacterium]